MWHMLAFVAHIRSSTQAFINYDIPWVSEVTHNFKLNLVEMAGGSGEIMHWARAGWLADVCLFVCGVWLLCLVACWSRARFDTNGSYALTRNSLLNCVLSVNRWNWNDLNYKWHTSDLHFRFNQTCHVGWDIVKDIYRYEHDIMVTDNRNNTYMCCDAGYCVFDTYLKISWIAFVMYVLAHIDTTYLTYCMSSTIIRQRKKHPTNTTSLFAIFIPYQTE